MKKSFLFNVFLMVFVNFLIKPFYIFGIDRTVQNQLGEQTYGLFFAIFNFTYLFQIFLDFGLQNYNSRIIAENNRNIDEYLPSLATFKMVLFLIYLAISIPFAYQLNYLKHSFIWLIFINQFLLSFIIYLRTNVSAHQHFITDSFLSILDKILIILFCSILIWGKISWLSLSIFNFALAQTIAYSITFLVCFFVSIKLIIKPIFKFNFKQFKYIIYTSLPYAIIHFLMTIYYRIDGVMIEKILGKNGAIQSGIYAQSYRIIESLNNIGYLLSMILMPIFVYKITQNENIKTILKSSISILFCISISIIIAFVFYKKNIIQILYPNTDVQLSSNIFMYLVFNFFPVAILYVIGTLLTANKNFKIMIPTLVLAVFLNIFLNYFLIHKIGVVGAAKATLITQFFILFTYSFFIIKTFNLKITFQKLFPFFAFAILCILAIFALAKIANIYHIYWLYILCIYFICIPIFAILTQLLNKKTLEITVGIKPKF